MFMNEWDIAGALARHAKHPVLGPATRFLADYRDEVNAHSDGWPYWSPPVRAAKALMELIKRGDDFALASFIRTGAAAPVDVTEADLAKALRPIKAFMTRRGNAAGMKLPPLRKEIK